MKQKLLFILICLWGISNVSAQISMRRGTGYSASPVKVTGQFRAAAAAAGSFYFGYCDEAITTGVGMGQTVEGSAAICMPASLAGLYAGKTITKIRIGMVASCTNVSIWIRNALTGNNLISQTVGNVNQGWTEVTLSTPFTIPSSDFYIGYTSTGLFPFGFSGSSVYDACWLWDSTYGWQNYVNNWGSLCLQALIDTQGATVLGLKPESTNKSVQGSINTGFPVQSYVTNYSSVDVTSVKVVYQIDNQTPVEQTIQTSIAPMKSDYLNMLVNAISAKGIYNLSFKITEVNGQPNLMANTALNTEIKILSQSFPRKVVLEEGTGTWCGWCPRGAVGMALMKAKYPDTFIGIAVHDGDPMTLQDYDYYMVSNFFTGFPEAVVDRKAQFLCDPYSSSEYYFQLETHETPIAGIQLSGGFANANKTAITLKTVTTFGVSSNNTVFKLAYVLIENGITGYDQQNYYAGGGAGIMAGYENKPSVVTDVVFNDVARGIYSDPAGITGSIPASITEMTPVEHTYTINLPTTVKDKNQLEVAVLLLNATTGEIENAEKIEISGVYDPTGIKTPEPFAANVYVSNGSLYIQSGVSEAIDIYTVSGVKIFNATKSPGVISASCDRFPKGLLIVKGSSGWVKKVENH